ncbi:hypothetical protein [Dictyobacter aurantiacus]|uniref:Uncharacterized protein n=1 Tax=Dictyobacter aurantiacus TaxID=1936993 RepID=A0A401ZR09_9CHLR|nr:hypothetical protein [Dictyobacter aurantiacus]GCE09214.1 hypothetical protein KDAU_65430 [Dictyobacter aurantiacus]
MNDSRSKDAHNGVQEKSSDDLVVDLSLLFARAMRANPNTCFSNVIDMMVHYLPEAFSAAGKLVEGWYVVDLEDEVVINEHGWYALPDGQILDPTVVILVPPDRSVYYFSGVERTYQEVNMILQQKEAWFPYVRCVGTYGEDGLGHPDYAAAYEAARKKALALAHASTPPKHMTFLTAQDLEGPQEAMELQVHLFLVSPTRSEEEQSGEVQSDS